MADSTLLLLNNRATLALTDKFYVVDAAAGTPADWNATLTALQTLVSGRVKIEEQTPTGTGVTFSALGAFTHLELVWSARGDQVAIETAINLTFNADTGNNYDRQLIAGAAAVLAGTETIAFANAALAFVSGASAPAGASGAGTAVIQDYRGTAFRKSVVSHYKYKTADASGGIRLRSHAIEWRSTAAITSIELALASGNFDTGSKFTLYGLK